MNADLVKKSAGESPNPYILVNLVSRRVRQLNGWGGGTSRPLVSDVDSLGAADTLLNGLRTGFQQASPNIPVLRKVRAWLLRG
jgi:hypothetical protein